ncbi:MAG: heme o synthase [Rickettsiaceae bacterium]|nr:heme o synthase [Rickettsiaceae bacterium]
MKRRKLHPKILAYINLIKPGVIGLVIFTTLVAAIIAPTNLGIAKDFAVIVSISIAAAGSAALNMWYDRDIDALMQRTSKRSTVKGSISSYEALRFGLLASTIAIALMFYTTNIYAASLLAFTSFFYAVIYTIFLKRSTIQNIVIGGAAGALPPVVAWFALTQGFGVTPWLLFLIIFLWTPPHFWALSIHYHKDYKNCNVPMMVNVKGLQYTKVNILIYSILLFCISLLPYFLGIFGILYFIAAILLGGRFLFHALKIFTNNSHAIKLFLFSIFYLFALFTAILLDHVNKLL